MTDLRQAAAEAAKRNVGKRVAALLQDFHERAPNNGPASPEFSLGKACQIIDIVADRVLAALSASIGEDVVEAAARALVPFAYGSFEHQIDRDGNRVQPALQPNDRARKAVRAILPIIALAARDATLEEAASKFDLAAATFRQNGHEDRAGQAEDDAASVRAMKGGPARG